MFYGIMFTIELINEFGEVIVTLFTVSGFGLIKVW